MPRDLDLVWDTATGEFTFGREVGNYVKRGETLTVSLTIKSDGVDSTSIPANAICTLKPVNDYDPTHALATWTGFVQVGSTNVFAASATINAAYVTTLLGLVQDSKNCIMDISGDGVNESDTLAVVLKNNVTRDNDVPPSPSGAREFYAGQVNGYADGTWATGLATTGFVTGMLYKFVDEDGALRQFFFKVSASATVLPGIRRPDDYNVSTNPRVFWQA